MAMTGKGLKAALKAAGLLAGLGLAAGLASALAVPATHHGPAFTDAQVTAGAKVYGEHCAACHGPELKGAAGPALAGAGFIDKWASGLKTVATLHDLIKSQMPKAAPGSLSDSQYIDLTALILSHNGWRSGEVAMASNNFQAVLLPPTGSGKAAAPRVRPKTPSVPTNVGKATTNRPDDAEIATPSEADWLMYNKNLNGQRYSKLDQITVQNVKNLTPSCMFQLGEVGWFQAAPVVYDGMMYVTSPYTTYAINPKTCDKIWETSTPADNSLPVVLSRGVAIYRGKLFRVTSDGHFLALDAKTGAILWDVLLSDKGHGYWLSAAPIAYDGKVFIGEAGADWGANGHIYALDTETGKVLWTFNVIPTGKEVGADTWKSGAELGGGSSWSTYTLQRDKGLLYVSVGNPSPDYDGAMRPGDNLFTNSVVALDYRTGKLVWYAQQIPHDTHDWDTAAAPVVYDQGGKRYMAVANKGGWLYIYDRKSHKLLHRESVTTHLNDNVPFTPEGVHYCPGIVGGVEWNGPAYSPKLGTLFVNSVDWCGTSSMTETRYIEGMAYYGGTYSYDPIETAKGWTNAFDGATGKLLWTRKSPTPMVAALTPTAGGVVFTGDLNGRFLALDAKTGDTLYQFNTGGAVAGAPSTYLVDGKQYVAITTGNSSRTIWQKTGAMTVVVFALPDKK